MNHFLFVVNNSDDGTQEYLLNQDDCSVWETQASYKLSRFGMDWLGYLQWPYGKGRWCLTVDADELLVYPDYETRDLHDLTQWLECTGKKALGAQLLDLYPKGSLADHAYVPGENPLNWLTHYDAQNTTHILQSKHRNQWIQGGPRARVFFDQEPKRAPTLNKIPLVKWDSSFVYVTSTHILLPRSLNAAFDATQGMPFIGCLLHTKFLDSVVSLSTEEKHRSEHFENSALYTHYYDALTKNPRLWRSASRKYRGVKGFT